MRRAGRRNIGRASMMRPVLVLAVIALGGLVLMATALAPKATTGVVPEGLRLPATRTALLSFTYQPPDWSSEAFAETFDFVHEHADMIAHFLDDGVPWDEALRGQPFPPALEEDLERRVTNRRPGQKVLLAINPVSSNRNDLAKYLTQDGARPLPPTWASKKWSDPEVSTAYGNYVVRIAQRLSPDYVCFAFEVNSNFHEQPAEVFAAFIGFLRTIHDRLRRDLPAVPLSIEVVLGDDAYMAERWRYTIPLFEFADIIGVSTYPYIFDTIGGDAGNVPADWFRRLAKRANGKPLAVSETGFLGADFLHAELGTWIPGRGKVLIMADEASQAKYVQFLLTEAHELGFRWVNWWVWRDLDKLWERIAGNGVFADPMMGQWNHTGLQDAEGNPRSGQRIWEAWKSVPRSRNLRE